MDYHSNTEALRKDILNERVISYEIDQEELDMLNKVVDYSSPENIRNNMRDIIKPSLVYEPEPGEKPMTCYDQQTIYLGENENLAGKLISP